MPAVAADIVRMTAIITLRRPRASARRPSHKAPNGRARNAVAKTANAAKSVPDEFCSGKNSGVMMLASAP